MKTIIETAFHCFWHFAGMFTIGYMIAYFTINGIIRFWTRLMRMIMVTSKGWPPSHLDADGDFKDADSDEVSPTA